VTVVDGEALFVDEDGDADIVALLPQLNGAKTISVSEGEGARGRLLTRSRSAPSSGTRTISCGGDVGWAIEIGRGGRVRRPDPGRKSGGRLLTRERDLALDVPEIRRIDAGEQVFIGGQCSSRRSSQPDDLIRHQALTGAYPCGSRYARALRRRPP
jgi:hypothetical protein